jgi:hypothetical protein
MRWRRCHQQQLDDERSVSECASGASGASAEPKQAAEELHVPTTELVLVFARSDRTTSSTALNVGAAWVSGIV